MKTSKNRQYQDCLVCNKKKCDEECFNMHPGSIIALKKISKKTHIIR